ncbi:MAG: hypothetical protein EBU93_06785, partial [Chlamydiae bacterium]|nr:hypothetical protein [Chlamydiota bacterium]
MTKTILPLLVLFLSLSEQAIMADSDTLPLNKKTPVIKESDSANVTQKLQKGSGKAVEINPAIEETETPRPYVASIGVYGTKKLNEVILKEELGPELDEWIKKGLAADEKSLALEKKLIQKIQKKYNFPFAEFSVVQFFEPDNLSVHIVLDVVEEKDVETRNRFLSKPQEQLTDPDRLIQTWLEYENLGMDLIEAGELTADAQKCSALHCPFGHEHPKLKKYEKIFVEGVPKNFEKLVQILGKDKREDWGKKSRDWTIKNYSVEVVGDKISKFIDDAPFTDYDFS